MGLMVVPVRCRGSLPSRRLKATFELQLLLNPEVSSDGEYRLPSPAQAAAQVSPWLSASFTGVPTFTPEIGLPGTLLGKARPRVEFNPPAARATDKAKVAARKSRLRGVMVLGNLCL